MYTREYGKKIRCAELSKEEYCRLGSQIDKQRALIGNGAKSISSGGLLRFARQ